MRCIAIYLMMPILLSVAGCASMHVDTDYDKKTDFSIFKTVVWSVEQQEAMMDMNRKEETVLLEKRIRKAIASNLTAKGYNFVDGESADLMIYWEAVQGTDLNVQQGSPQTYSSSRDTSGFSSSYTPPTGASVSVSSYGEITLVIELIDARTMRLVWRGKGWGALAPDGGSQENVTEAVQSILAHYPPGAG